MTFLILAYAAIFVVVVGLAVRMLMLSEKFARDSGVVGHHAHR